MKIFRNLPFLFLAAFFSCWSLGQEKVQWTFDFDADSSYILLHAKMNEGWHVYSQFIAPDAGPVPTEFEFQDNPNVRLNGKVQEAIPVKVYDANFGAEVLYFGGETTFKQKIELKKATILKGSVVYMVCNDEMCLPPTEKQFEIKLTK